jgi:hypothetical protein
MGRRSSLGSSREPNTDPPVKRLSELNLNPSPAAVRAHTTQEQLSPTISRTRKLRSKSVSLPARAHNSPLVLEDPRFTFYPPVGTTTTSAISSQTHSWEPTLERAIKAIVSIQANHVRSFDTETAGKSFVLFMLVDLYSF